MKFRSSSVYTNIIRPLGVRVQMEAGELGLGSRKLPPGLKHGIVRRYVRRYRPDVLVETGTAQGDLIEAVRDLVASIYSIELDEVLWLRAKERFPQDHIHLLHGDSQDVLPALMTELRGSCLFWLDAHAMRGGVQGRGVTPIREELDWVLRDEGRGDVVLIDDARLFGCGAYPTHGEVENRVRSRWPEAEFGVRNDIIRVVG